MQEKGSMAMFEEEEGVVIVVSRLSGKWLLEEVIIKTLAFRNFVRPAECMHEVKSFFTKL